MKFTLIFAFWIAVLQISPSSAAEAADSGPVDYVWWRMTGQEWARDGGVVTSYELVFSRSRGDIKLSDAEVVFTSTRRGAGGAASEIFTKDISQIDGTYHVDIYSGRNEKIVLLAKARAGEKQFYAGTLLRGFGQSGNTDPEATRIETMPYWPRLLLVGEEYFYRAQTGAPLNVHIKNAKTMHIFENGALVGALAPSEAGFYTYTPPHDQELSRAGFSAKNDLVFVAVIENENAVISLYLPIYRAFYGQIDLKGGLGVTAASALLCLASVLYSGRRFRWK